MIDDQIIDTYFNKENINKIINGIKDKNYNDFKKSFHYELSLLRKGTNEKEIIEIYPKFDKINLIHVRKLKYGDISHDLHYELDDGTFIVIAICIEKGILINAFHAHKNFKKLKEALFKFYYKKA